MKYGFFKNSPKIVLFGLGIKQLPNKKWRNSHGEKRHRKCVSESFKKKLQFFA